MATSTNTAINSRSMNGVITITDGTATLEDGDLNCNDINSDSINTASITTGVFTCNGEFRSNLVGPYSIPVSTTAIMGSLISYGNVSNSGATDFTNYGSTYNLLKQGFYFNNINSTQTLTNLAIIDNSQTYFKSQLVGCTAETPLSNTSVVNKSYCDDNFMYKTNNIQESITGWKTFSNRVDLNGGTALVVSSGTSSFGGISTFNAQTTFNTVAPISNTEPTLSTHLTTKNYCDNTFVDKTTTQSITGLKTFTNDAIFNASLLLKNKKRLNGYQNIITDTTISLSFPLPETSAIKTITPSVTSITINLPTVTANEVGLLFNFFKFQYNLNVILTSTSRIYTLNAQGAGPTTNTTLLSSDKIMTTLMCGATGTLYYWVEVNTYSTFDRDYNNSIYPRLSIANTFTNTNTFNSQLTIKNKLSFVDILYPFTKTTDTYQSSSIMINEQNFNLGSYQFKTRDSGGALTSNLTIANTGITIFGKTTGGIFEGTTYNSTSANTDMAIGGSSTTGKILIGTVLNGGELRLGTTLSINNINGLTTFQKIPLVSGTQSPILDNELTSKLYVDSMPVHQILNTNNTWTGTNNYNTYLPTSTLTPTTGTQLITKNFSDARYIDFTTDQTISANNKRFNGLFTTGLSITPTLGGAGNRQQMYITGTELSFNPLFNSNYYRFYCKDSLANQINPLEISYTSTVINNSLTSNGQATFNTYTPISSVASPTANNHLTRKDYIDNNFVDKTTSQTIAGNKTFSEETFFNNWVSLKFRTRIYDLNGLGNYTQMYMIGGNEFVIGGNANGDKISFYCKDATLGQLNTFISSALGNSSLVNLTCSASLISNNLTAPSSTIAGTNNLYTNLDTVNGFGVVNFGAKGNNINIKCNLNINESVYGTSQNTVVNMEGNSLRFTNNGSTNGDYIFTINESGTYNPLVINKTSVDIAGDANITGSLILYDTVPSTKTISASLVGNNVIFDPLNTVSTTYQFKTNDSGGTETTPLTISSSGITLTNTTSTNVLYTKDLRWYDAGGGSNIQQIFLSGNNLSFVPLFNNNQYSFQCKDSVPTITTPLTINSTSTTIQNNLISNSQATFNTYTPISSVASPTANNHLTRKDYVDNNFMYKINNVAESINGVKTFGNRVNLYGQTALIVGDGTATSGGAEFNGTTRFNNTVLYSQATININSTATSHNVNLFSAITSGTLNFFSSLSNSLVSMFSSSTNDVTLEINAKVKFRQVKLYNQVKTITATITLTFPLEEQIVIRPTATTYIELPVITANSLGMSFNFITNSTAYAIWFETQGTDNIIKNGYTTGNTSTVVLGTNGITSVQMTCLELTAGVYSWSFFSSLPEKVSNPPGTIITMAVQSTPNGYLACDGGSYSFSGIYSNLYQVIGTTYGSSGVGTFKVPNFNNGSFLRGVGGNSAVIATQQQDNIKTHTHNTTFYRFEKGSSGGTNVISDLSTGNLGSTVVTSATNTAGSPDETRPINYAVHYCIKY